LRRLNNSVAVLSVLLSVCSLPASAGGKAAELLQKGITAFGASNYTAAEDNFKSALTEAGNEGKLDVAVESLTGLTNTALLRRQFKEAEKYSRAQLKLLRDDDRIQRARALTNLALAVSEQGQDAESDFASALSEAYLAQSESEVCKVVRMYAAVLGKAGDYTKAISVLKTALDKPGTPVLTELSKARLNHSVGKMYISLGQLEMAEPFVRHSADFYQSSESVVPAQEKKRVITDYDFVRRSLIAPTDTK